MKKYLIIIFLFFFGFTSNAQDGKYIETNGVEIYFETYGSGEPLLLLHGFLGSNLSWSTWIEDLSKDYQLIVPDLRGHGRSTNPSEIFTHELSAKDMFGLLDKLEIDKFKAIGFSSGAITLMHMATIDSSRVSKMILVGASSYIPNEFRLYIKNFTNEPLSDNAKKWLDVHHPGGEEKHRKLLTMFRSFADSYDDVNFTPPYLSTLKCQTLIIQGDRDEIYPFDIAADLHKAIPNSFLWILPNTTHYAVETNGVETIWHNVALQVFNEFLKGKWN